MTRPARATLALLLALAAAGCAERPPNVLVIVLDTVRCDHLGAYGYPRDTTPTLDRVAAEGARLDAALATSTWSPPSHTSILTGLPPERHHVHRWGHGLPAALPTLAERLAARGYRTGLFSSHGGLRKGVRDLERGFEERVGENRKDDAEVVARAAAWTGAAREPWYAHVILMGAHAPYDQYPPEWNASLFTDLPPGERGRPEWRRFGPDSVLPDAYQIGDERRIGEYLNRYDRALRQLDTRVADLLGALAQRGRLDRTLLVVTSDHGESIGERDRFGHGEVLYEHVVRVPLLLRLPGRAPAGAVWREATSLLDLVPTVLGTVGAPPAAELPGVDLVAHLAAGTRPPPRVHEAAVEEDGAWRLMVRDDRHKLLYDDGLGRYELYDLARDPDERNDLLAGGAPVAQAAPPGFPARIQALAEVYRGVDMRPARELAPDAVEALRALGYVAPDAAD